MISDEYRKLNETMHNTVKGWGCGGARWADHVKNLCVEMDTTSVLDYGCGKGTLASELPFEIQSYDPAVPKFNAEPQPAALVVCTDVLEHIESDYLDGVLAHISELAMQKAFLNISTRPAHRRLADGRNAHLIVKPKHWWLKKLADYFVEIESVEEHPGEFTVLATPVHAI